MHGQCGGPVEGRAGPARESGAPPCGKDAARNRPGTSGFPDPGDYPGIATVSGTLAPSSGL